jgi:hypothetical protein
MPNEISNDRKEALKSLFNNSVKLLELLNILIPKVESYSSTIPADLLEEVSQKCFELGATIAAGAEEIAGSDDDEFEINPYPFGL